MALWSSGALGRIGGARSPAFELREPRTGKQRYGGFVMECFQRRGPRLQCPCRIRKPTRPQKLRVKSEGAVISSAEHKTKLRRTREARVLQNLLSSRNPAFFGERSWFKNALGAQVQARLPSASSCRRGTQATAGAGLPRAETSCRAGLLPPRDCQSVV